MKNNLKEGDLTRSFLIMFSSTMVVNIINYIYNLLVGRFLGPSDYGVFVSLLSFTMIFAGISGTVQIVITRYAAILKYENSQRTLYRYFIRAIQIFSVVGLFVFILFFISTPYIKKFLNIDVSAPVYVVGMLLGVSFIAPIARGMLQGIQDYKALSINVILDSFLRLVFGLSLIFLGLKVSGAIGSQVISAIVAFSVSIYFILRLKSLDEGTYRIPRVSIYRYTFLTLYTMSCFLLLTNLDVVLVKHFFDPHTAGIYSSAVTIGRIILYFPGAMAIVLFPKTSELQTLSKKSVKILAKALLIVFVLCLIINVIYFVAPDLLVRIMFGKAFFESVPYIGYYGIAMTFYSLLNITVLFLLSLNFYSLIPVLTITSLLELILLNYYHKNLLEVIYILILVSLSSLVTLILIIVFNLLKNVKNK
ncbi:MAG: oligosaccharide flippase family protein [Actinobacteria bacterium]|nr:oligosaccharide flippase family protein [Actinomycetota bacterium]